MAQETISFRMRRNVALEGLRVLHRHLGRAPAHWALTHINEARNSVSNDLKLYMMDFLDDVRPYLTDDDYGWVAQVAIRASQTPQNLG